MLQSLEIRNVVIIDELDLSFHDGLCVLTGETGAGKSILLDALGLALGSRGDAKLVRGQAASPRPDATVAASFSLPERHPVIERLADSGIERPDPGEPLILRRTLSHDGRSRCFINDQSVSVRLLRDVGQSLIEIEGRYASQGLLDEVNHRRALDNFGGFDSLLAEVANAFDGLVMARDALAEAQDRASKARDDEEYLRHVTAELEALDPKPGEERELAEMRSLMMNSERLVEAITTAVSTLTDDQGVEERLSGAQRLLSRQDDSASEILTPALEALDRAGLETAEALAALRQLCEQLNSDPDRLEAAEERLFALRAAARKHNTDVESLPALRERFAAELGALDDEVGSLPALARAAEEARASYSEVAGKLSEARRSATQSLDAAIIQELAPLKLENAVFRTVVEPLDEASWGRTGGDRVRFEVSTNPGVAPGSIAKVASAGELSRLMLALKVVLTGSDGPALVFDEVDSGIGGATAAAVGERLQRLGEEQQVLVITHSPQVAARGIAHWRVEKSDDSDETVTRVEQLSGKDRREEIARMLAGKTVTDEARAAADILIRGGAR